MPTPKDWTSLRRSLEHFCARRERAPSEVRNRMAQLGLTEAQAQALWEHLTRERFVDEQRFARAFANDKMRFERRGRLYIRQALRQKGIAPGIIEQTLLALDPDEYAAAFRQALAQKRRHYHGRPDADFKVRAALFRAGFEPELWDEISRSEH